MLLLQQRFKTAIKFALTLLIVAFVLSACSAETGTLRFDANGEDFVRQGFVSKDGWRIDFERVAITLDEIIAYKTDPPYDASTGISPEGDSVAVAEMLTIDLAEGGEDAPPLAVGSVEAETGQYNALSWQMVNGDDGVTLHINGTASKADSTIDFDFAITDEYSYMCGEYVGDERIGFVDPDETGRIEMTFHFDHIFGDADTEPDEALNAGALGFDPLAALATDGSLQMTQAELEQRLSAEHVTILRDTLATLGHVGEGHCFEATNGFTGNK